MKVALVHDHLNQLGGAERVVKQFHRLWPDAPLYTLVHDPKRIASFFDSLEIRPSFIQQMPFALSHLRWYLWLMPAAIESFDLSEYDVIISSASAFGKGAISAPRSVHICYCHTPTRYLWSDTNTYVSDLSPRSTLVKHALPVLLNRLRMWDQLAAQRVDHFIANSLFVARRIKRYYNRDSTVIYPPVDVTGYPMLPRRNYFIILGRLRPYKKVDIAIRAFNRLNLPLVVVGEGEEEGRLRKIAGPSISFAGYVNDARRKELLSQAAGFIHPQEEDFGISAVEAMAAGVPVIAYQSGGVLETVIEGATGLFFEEQTWQSLADAVIRMRRMTFEQQFIRGHAQQFGEERFKEHMSDFVRARYGEAPKNI